jgi:uncharacterized membrane protein
MSAHLFTVLPAALLGTYLILRPKGTPSHRLLGKVYMILMLTTAALSLLIPATVGPQLVGHLGLIHILSFVVLFSVPRAYFAARNHNLVQHKIAMIGVYVGGILVAGGFTLAPGRYLNQLLLG